MDLLTSTFSRHFLKQQPVNEVKCEADCSGRVQAAVNNTSPLSSFISLPLHSACNPILTRLFIKAPALLKIEPIDSWRVRAGGCLITGRTNGGETASLQLTPLLNRKKKKRCFSSKCQEVTIMVTPVVPAALSEPQEPGETEWIWTIKKLLSLSIYPSVRPSVHHQNHVLTSLQMC